MVPRRTVDGFLFQVKRNAEVPKIRKDGLGFTIWFPSSNRASMLNEDGIIIVGYAAAATWGSEPATDQIKAKELFEMGMKLVPVDV